MYNKGDTVKSLQNNTRGDGKTIPKGTLLIIEETPETDPYQLGGYYLRVAKIISPEVHIGIHPDNMNPDSFQIIKE